MFCRGISARYTRSVNLYERTLGTHMDFERAVLRTDLFRDARPDGDCSPQQAFGSFEMHENFELKCREIALRQRSRSTREKYEQLWDRMQKAGQGYEEFTIGKSKSYRYLAKAAFQWGLASQGLDAVRYDWEKSIAEIDAELGMCDPDYRHEHLVLHERKGKLFKKRRVRPGRLALQGLPVDWRERVVEASSEKYRLATSVLAVSGCRPAELAKGILVKAGIDCINLTVLGAKTGQGHGQTERVIELDLSSHIARDIHQKALAEPGGLLVTAEADSFSHSFRRACRRALGRGVGPYCCRYQFSADLKAALTPEEAAIYSEEDIALAMGHMSVKSQQYYGTAHQARGGGGVRWVRGSQPVKGTRSRGGFDPSPR